MSGKHSGSDIIRIASELREAIDLAAFGELGWEEVAKTVTRAFPGAATALYSMDTRTGELNFTAQQDWNPDFFEAFLNRYSAINPWNSIWQAAASGKVLVTQRDLPASQLRGSEFYEDWLVPHGDVEAGTGLKLQAGSHDLVMVPIHYPLELAGDYDKAIAAVLERARGGFDMALRMSRRWKEAGEALAAASATVGRFSEAALVVDGGMRVREANALAEREFASGRFLQCAAGRLAIADPSAHALLARSVGGIAGDRPGEQSGLETVFRRRVWRLSWSGLPRLAVQGVLAPPPSRLVLVLARNLTESSPAGGIEGFARLFRLTPAEAKLCMLLAEGMSLDRIAEATRVSKETARHRLKIVFQKTSCHRQGQLVSLIARHLH